MPSLRVFITLKSFFLILVMSSVCVKAQAEGFEGILLSGSNPQVNEIGKISGLQDFNYSSYGTREIGLGLLYDKNLFSITFADPRDNSSQRTKTAIIDFRTFGEIQWGAQIRHFKGFGLYQGSDSHGQKIADRPDIELFSSQFFILKNLNHPEYSIQDALNGMNQITESGWSSMFGGTLATTYLKGDDPLVPASYASTMATQVNSYNLAATIGIAGTYVYQGFYVAGHVSLGGGPVHSTWKDATGEHSKFKLFGFSHVLDYAFGYSAQKWSLFLKLNTLSDSSDIEGVSFQNLSTNTSLNFSYRF